MTKKQALDLWGKVYTWVDNFIDGGWRKTFFWVSVGTMAVALPSVYVIQPFLFKTYAPGEFLTQLNATMVIVTGLAGMRAIEKHSERKIEAGQ